MPGREPHHIRRLITVIAAVAAAITITALSVPSAMAAQPTAPTPRAAASTTAAGSQEDQLNSVACRSANDCVAVGADYRTHTPLAETWNGTRWQAVSVKLPSSASGAYLNGVACPAATGTYCVAAGVMIEGSTGEALSETWNGRAWAPVLPPAPAGSQLEAISCLSAKSCVAVGAAGASHGIGALLTESWSGNVESGSIAYAEAWNGKTWAPTTVTVPGKDNASAFAWVTCLPGKTPFCAAVGDVGP